MPNFVIMAFFLWNIVLFFFVFCVCYLLLSHSYFSSLIMIPELRFGRFNSDCHENEYTNTNLRAMFMILSHVVSSLILVFILFYVWILCSASNSRFVENNSLRCIYKPYHVSTIWSRIEHYIRWKGVHEWREGLWLLGCLKQIHKTLNVFL